MTAKPHQRNQIAQYLLPLGLAPLVLIVAACFIVPSPWLAARSGNLYLANLGYGVKLHNRDCQILIYGDSGALTGVDPSVMQQRTGLSTCNIAEFQGMTLVNGTLPLDIFLAHNARPRYLLFLYAPENFSAPSSWAHDATFEAINFRMQQEPGLSTVGALAIHPAESLGWMELGLRLAMTRAFSRPYPYGSVHLRERDNGQLKILTDHTRTACDPRITHVAPDPRWIQSLRTRYATAGTTVLVDAMPSADCDPNNVWYDHQLEGLVDDQPLPHLPVNAFTQEGLLHTNQYGATLLSNLLADQIQARVQAQPASIAEANAMTLHQGTARSTFGER